MRIFLIVFVLTFLAATAPASAKIWVTDYAQSYLGFIAKQSDQTIKGRFTKFQTTIDFDTEHPENGEITASIDIASAISGSSDVDGSLPQSEWFNTKNFPKAEFATVYITSADKDSCYDASANLTIKGLTKPVKLAFCLTKEGDHMRAKGTATIMRKDFDVGTGQWSEEDVVANPVTVTLDIVAK